MVFLSYILLGLSLAAPIGPVNAAQLDRGIKNGFLHAWLVGIGATTADVMYMLAVYLGVVSFLEFPIVKTFLWLFGFFVLVYTGIESIVKAGAVERKERGDEETLTKSFFSGFLMSISNPLTILFWLGIYGSILAKTISTYNDAQVWIYSGAILVGVIVWDVTMAAIASGVRVMFDGKVLRWISIFSGLSLIGFGCYFGYEAVVLLLDS
ncbi:LysE family transporter [Shouchella shacheensis]|uniref:LysE family transporter n=1 Tax=Shouchella shacheensis TaxID=1649580 RepID=UPI00073FEFD6|nr:LysE family transporter [Shouchella shacheensis]